MGLLSAGEFVVAHNAGFDRSVLEAVCEHFEIAVPRLEWVCTCQLAKRRWPQLENHKLNTVCEAIGHRFEHHHAGEDAEAAGRVLLATGEIRTEE